MTRGMALIPLWNKSPFDNGNFFISDIFSQASLKYFRKFCNSKWTQVSEMVDKKEERKSRSASASSSSSSGSSSSSASSRSSSSSSSSRFVFSRKKVSIYACAFSTSLIVLEFQFSCRVQRFFQSKTGDSNAVRYHSNLTFSCRILVGVWIISTTIANSIGLKQFFE